MIEIKKFISPDLEIILPKPEGSYSSSSHFRYSIVFEDMMLVIGECLEDGTHKSYGSENKYYGLKLVKDNMFVCIPKFGWIPIYEEIQTKYNEQLAEKVILGDNKCNL